MSLSILNNTATLQAQTSLDQTSNALDTSLQRLSTGLKINSGADGPAAFVIANEQQAQVVGLQQAIQNTSQAVNVVQIAEGGLNEISNLLNQARALALDSANSGVNDSTALTANQAQLSNIISTINNIANTTQFGSQVLLNGGAGLTATTAPAGYTVSGNAPSAVGGTYQVTAFSAATLAHSTVGSAPAALGQGENGTLTINGTAIALNGGVAGINQAAVINAINAVTATTNVKAVTSGGNLQLVSTTFGAPAFTATITDGANAHTVANSDLAGDLGFTPAALNLGVITAGQGSSVTLTPVGGGTAQTAVGTGNTATFTSGTLAGTSITFAAGGTNPAYSTVGQIGDQITLQNGLTFQIGANAGDTATIGFANATANALGQGAATTYSSLGAISIGAGSNTSEAIKVIDQAINDVSVASGNLGAFQTNTLQANSDNLQTALQNTTSAESTIRDTDYASEISNYSSLQVQLQAGASVLGNANQLPSIIAQLLQKA